MQFGDWLVQPSLDLISRGPDQRKLERKAMQVLSLLLSRPGEVVSIQEILQQVWAGRVVEENSVHRRISQLRKALGDNAHHPTYVASVPRRGYRTLAPVQRPQRNPPEPMRAPEHPAVKPAQSPAPAAGAMLLTPDSLRTDAVLFNVLRQLRHWHHAVLLGTGRWPVVLLVLLATVPVLVNAVRHDSPPVTILQNGDLLLYGLFLPLWFVCFRWVMRLSYGLTIDSPLAADRRFQPMLQLAQAHLQAGWPPVLALVCSSVLLGLQQWAGAVTLPLAQLVLGYLIALSAIYVLLFSYAYNQGIYLRASERRAHQYVL
ncbi:MAG: transcriptional regulator, partial [Pseudomonadota bacterium]